MKTMNTQEILTNFFTKEVKDLTPVDYNLYIQAHNQDFQPLPANTVIVAAGDGYEDEDIFVVRYPDNTYHIVDKHLTKELDFEETPDLPLKTPVAQLYPIEHYDANGTHHHFTSFTSLTGLLIHNIVDDVDPSLGGMIIYTEQNLKNTRYNL